MTDRHPIDDPELDAVPADAEDEEEAGLYEHFAVTADKGQTPMRLDKFLTVRMEHCSRNRIQAAADSGNILVNGKAAKSSYKVKPLDRIQIVMPYPRREVELVAEDIPLDIPYEDQWLLLVDKPAGLVVHPGVGNYSGTLVNALMHHLNKQGIPAEEQNRAGLVHRIDKNTSGLLVIAKDEQTHARLAKQFFDHTIQRRYVALVWGNFDEDEGTITGNIGRSPKDRQKMFVFADGSDGKHAVTHWKVLKRYGYVTLVECRLETGRTHQIRVHMATISSANFQTPYNNQVYELKALNGKLLSFGKAAGDNSFYAVRLWPKGRGVCLVLLCAGLLLSVGSICAARPVQRVGEYFGIAKK